jgi:hypothetical protein
VIHEIELRLSEWYVPTRRKVPIDYFAEWDLEAKLMPEYVVVARMALKTPHALGRFRSPRAVRVPGTWHLAQIVSGLPSAVKVCGDPTIEPQATRPVRDWEIVKPRCPECERKAGEAARTQAASEARSPRTGHRTEATAAPDE